VCASSKDNVFVCCIQPPVTAFIIAKDVAVSLSVFVITYRVVND